MGDNKETDPEMLADVMSTENVDKLKAAYDILTEGSENVVLAIGANEPYQKCTLVAVKGLTASTVSDVLQRYVNERLARLNDILTEPVSPATRACSLDPEGHEPFVEACAALFQQAIADGVLLPDDLTIEDGRKIQTVFAGVKLPDGHRGTVVLIKNVPPADMEDLVAIGMDQTIERMSR